LDEKKEGRKEGWLMRQVKDKNSKGNTIKFLYLPMLWAEMEPIMIMADSFFINYYKQNPLASITPLVFIFLSWKNYQMTNENRITKIDYFQSILIEASIWQDIFNMKV
jgi:hypothetical protein